MRDIILQIFTLTQIVSLQILTILYKCPVILLLVSFIIVMWCNKRF